MVHRSDRARVWAWTGLIVVLLVAAIVIVSVTSGSRNDDASAAPEPDGDVSTSTTKAAAPTTSEPSTDDSDGNPDVDLPPDPVPEWAPLAAITVVDPIDFGASGDGETDDLPAVEAAIAALPAAGGIVYLGDGLSFLTTDVLRITTDHVKLWSPDGQGEIKQVINGNRRRQAIICEHSDGCGFFGLHLRSDASSRFDALEDHQIAVNDGINTEIVGNEIEGGAAAGIFFTGGSRTAYVEGNYIHHTWADSIHFTGGTRDAWVWSNVFFNEEPSRGDDGIACVTYADSPRCGDMEWWNNTHLGNAWGRGYAVVGGKQIEIHHNFARDTAAAGILLASEPSFNTRGSREIFVHDNVLYRTAAVVRNHSGILVSGPQPGRLPDREHRPRGQRGGRHRDRQGIPRRGRLRRHRQPGSVDRPRAASVAPTDPRQQHRSDEHRGADDEGHIVRE